MRSRPGHDELSFSIPFETTNFGIRCYGDTLGQRLLTVGPAHPVGLTHYLFSFSISVLFLYLLRERNKYINIRNFSFLRGRKCIYLPFLISVFFFYFNENHDVRKF